MDNCPVFLKKGKQGITFIELLIVLAFIGFLAVAVLVALNPAVQIGKARDARRKADLKKLQNIWEDYYNDRNCYPPSLVCGESLLPYLSKIPCDPLTQSSYGYMANCSSYRIYAKLEYEKDPAIARVGCQDGCWPGAEVGEPAPGGNPYNYGVSSPNVSLQKCGRWFACQVDICNQYTVKPSCLPVFACDSTCGGGCTGDKICLP